jgi:hypothetical protein
LSDVTEIKSGTGKIRQMMWRQGFAQTIELASTSAARGQHRASISIAFAGRQAGVDGGVRNCGIRTWRKTCALEPKCSASQWIAATTLKVTSGSAKNERNSAAVLRLRRRPLKVAARRGPRSQW